MLLQTFLGWSILINYSILFLWFFLFLAARPFLYKTHTQWFRLTPEQFDQTHYAAMAFFKLSILLLNLTPYLALRLTHL